MSTVLRLSGLAVPFGNEPGLTGLNLAVRSGERVALVGASGVGKTSLLRAIAGTGPVAKGRIVVAEQDVTTLPPEKRDVVLLSQRPLLFPHLSVYENVAFPLRVRRVPGDEIPGRVEEALTAVHMEAFRHRRPRQLSGGQAHRVALARAVVARPAILLLDEPLTALDPVLRGEVRQAILDASDRFDTALLMVTHDLDQAGSMAHRIGVLLDGGLVQVDTPEGLFRRPATPGLARFLGLPNQLSGRLTCRGELTLAGWPVEGSGQEAGHPGAPVTGDPGSGQRVTGDPPSGQEITAVFGASAVRIAGPGEAPIAATVTAVRHRPDGVTVVVEIRRREEPSSPMVRLDADAGMGPVPGTGDAVAIRLLRDRIHLYPHPPADYGGTEGPSPDMDIEN